MSMTNLLTEQISDGDWQAVIAQRLALIRGLETPGGNEWYEASEAGAALEEAGFWLTRRSA